MSILLDDKGICKATGCTSMGSGVSEIIGQANKAQAKKIYEWGNEVCSHGTSIDGFGFVMTVRRGCQECWKELLKEIEL